MSKDICIEVVGYLGSALVLISFLMSSVVKLRVINTIGSSIFAVYAIIIQSYPTALMNGCLAAINIYYLVRVKKTDRHYDLIEGKAGDAFLQYILAYYQEDIRTYFPDLSIDDSWIDQIFIVCCDAVPAGVMLGRLKNEGTIDIVLDYSIPAYRDCSVGKYLYSQLAAKGFRKIVFCGNYEKHEGYLKKMGFGKENGRYTKNIN